MYMYISALSYLYSLVQMPYDAGIDNYREDIICFVIIWMKIFTII